MKTILCLCIFLIIAFSNDSISCTCPPTDRDTLVYENIKLSNIVFLGEAINIDTSYNFYKSKNEKYSHRNPFTFKILELYKGNNLGKKIIKGANFNNCCIWPNKIGQLFIVFATFEKDSLINMSYCTNTISLEAIAPPIFENANELEKLNYKISSQNTQITRLTDWNYCLEKLRDYKRSNEKKSKIKTPFWESKFFQIGLIGMNIIILILLFFKKRK